MDLADIKFCQQYFKSEERNPSITEIRMIDTYWSDHCRHTTFSALCWMRSRSVTYRSRKHSTTT